MEKEDLVIALFKNSMAKNCSYCDVDFTELTVQVFDSYCENQHVVELTEGEKKDIVSKTNLMLTMASILVKQSIKKNNSSDDTVFTLLTIQVFDSCCENQCVAELTEVEKETIVSEVNKLLEAINSKTKNGANIPHSDGVTPLTPFDCGKHLSR